MYLFVNALTVSRVPLSLLFCAAVLLRADPFLPCALFALIAASDYLDGRLARKYGVQTGTGAVMDVAADFFFMVTAGLSLFSRGLFPGWMLAVILYKFLEFWLTSALFRRGGKNAAVFLFDPLGRIAAVLFYLLPVLALLLSLCLPAAHRTVFGVVCAGIAALAVLSSARRILSLVDSP